MDLASKSFIAQCFVLKMRFKHYDRKYMYVLQGFGPKKVTAQQPDLRLEPGASGTVVHCVTCNRNYSAIPGNARKCDLACNSRNTPNSKYW